MFFRAYLLSFFLLIASIAGILRFLVFPSAKDTQNYFAAFEKNLQARSAKTLEKQPILQKKISVQKDLWIPHQGTRLHTRIRSVSSELILKQKKGKMSATETLQGIHTELQEEVDLIAQTQQVRAFSSAEGIYTYPEHRFTSAKVLLQFYELAGTELPASLALTSPYLRGDASEVIFSATSSLPLFRAYHLKAKVDGQVQWP